MPFYICCDVIRQMLLRGLQHKFAMSWLQIAVNIFYSSCCTFTIAPSIAHMHMLCTLKCLQTTLYETLKRKPVSHICINFYDFSVLRLRYYE